MTPTVSFLRRILPPAGLYIAARLVGKHFRNRVCGSIEELAQQVLEYDAQGVAAYHACAAYHEHEVDGIKDGKPIKQVRVQRNVRALRSFFMDLDVEAGNPNKFSSQSNAIDELSSFLIATELPTPMVVSSGGGIHIYWSLINEIIPEQWKPIADSLKALAAHHKFKSDPACTADSARVLRPVGTYNRKLPGARAVELVADADPLDYQSFTSLVETARKNAGIKPSEAVHKVTIPTDALNQEFAVTHDFPPCSARKVADRCPQLAKMRDTRGNVSEPAWYASIQLLCHSIEGDELIHEWSRGHPTYSVEETDKKIAQIRDQKIGPTLCSTFAGSSPGGCDACPFKGKISSPAQLGTQVVSAPPPAIEVKVGDTITQVILPNPPPPFTRCEGGGITIEEDGITHKIFEFDFFPIEIAFDEQLGYETSRWRHFSKREGWKEIVLRSSLIAKPVEFEIVLRDNHVQPLLRNKAAMFADSYLRKIKSEINLRKLFTSQGWKSDDKEFVLGDKLYRKGEVLQAGFSHSAESFLSPFRSRGSLQVWRDLTWAFNHPGLEAHAFMLLLAFASPLLKLGGREGFTVNALGESHGGKSTMARFMSSVYGTPKGSWITTEDTLLARWQRFGAHSSLPIYTDEATILDPAELRKMVYAVPTGRSRASMKRDYTLRAGAEWCLIFVMSANESMHSKLQSEKVNPEAESLRLFEYDFPIVPAFGPIAKMIPDILDENHGVAGPVYIKGLIENRNEIRERLRTVVQEAEDEFGMHNKERFWSQAVALSLYGGQLARNWGIIDFDPALLRPWLLKETQRMRGQMEAAHVDGVALLARWLDEHVGERLVTNQMNEGLGTAETKVYHRITQRLEKDTKLLYISKENIMQDLWKMHADPNKLCDELFAKGIMIHSKTKRVLGSGTNYGGGPAWCWMLKADHPELADTLKAAT